MKFSQIVIVIGSFFTVSAIYTIAQSGAKMARPSEDVSYEKMEKEVINMNRNEVCDPKTGLLSSSFIQQMKKVGNPNLLQQILEKARDTFIVEPVNEQINNEVKKFNDFLDRA